MRPVFHVAAQLRQADAAHIDNRELASYQALVRTLCVEPDPMTGYRSRYTFLLVPLPLALPVPFLIVLQRSALRDHPSYI